MPECRRLRTLTNLKLKNRRQQAGTDIELARLTFPILHN
jgi:hypothetical protein